MSDAVISHWKVAYEWCRDITANTTQIFLETRTIQEQTSYVVAEVTASSVSDENAEDVCSSIIPELLVVIRKFNFAYILLYF